MLDDYDKEGARFWAENCGRGGAHPYWTEADFARAFKDHAKCSVFEAKEVARRCWLLVALERAEDLSDMKEIIKRLIEGN